VELHGSGDVLLLRDFARHCGGVGGKVVQEIFAAVEQCL
jgi:hypothetical protein